ncbi:MAG: hypothetical protein DRO11_00940 [Methanobacteriota archaeon]|nr:MAG: hypothetical protein DRO11_00940 [Euryarchaeota archaeon]
MSHPFSPQVVQRFYDRIANIYDNRYGNQNPETVAMRDLENQLKKEYLRAGPTLDVGVGTGSTYKCSETSQNVFGVDVSLTMLQIARRRGVIPIRASVDHLPFHEASFKNVVCLFGVLNHTKNLEKPLKEIKRVMSHDGVLISSLTIKNNLRRMIKVFLKGKIPLLVRSMRKDKGKITIRTTQGRATVWTRFYTPPQIRKTLQKTGLTPIKWENSPLITTKPKNKTIKKMIFTINKIFKTLTKNRSGEYIYFVATPGDQDAQRKREKTSVTPNSTAATAANSNRLQPPNTRPREDGRNRPRP